MHNTKVQRGTGDDSLSPNMTPAAKVLFAVKVGREDWEEQLITEVESRIESASQWARDNGFDRLRVVTIDSAAPDFAATVTR